MSALPRKKNKLYMILGAVVVVAAAGYWYVHAKGTKKVEDQPLLAKVEMGSIENTIAAAGTLKPRSYVDVGAQVSGQLDRKSTRLNSSH